MVQSVGHVLSIRRASHFVPLMCPRPLFGQFPAHSWSNPRTEASSRTPLRPVCCRQQAVCGNPPHCTPQGRRTDRGSPAPAACGLMRRKGGPSSGAWRAPSPPGPHRRSAPTPSRAYDIGHLTTMDSTAGRAMSASLFSARIRALCRKSNFVSLPLLLVGASEDSCPGGCRRHVV